MIGRRMTQYLITFPGYSSACGAGGPVFCLLILPKPVESAIIEHARASFAINSMVLQYFKEGEEGKETEAKTDTSIARGEI